MVVEASVVAVVVAAADEDEITDAEDAVKAENDESSVNGGVADSEFDESRIVVDFFFDDDDAAAATVEAVDEVDDFRFVANFDDDDDDKDDFEAFGATIVVVGCELETTGVDDAPLSLSSLLSSLINGDASIESTESNCSLTSASVASESATVTEANCLWRFD